MSHPPHLMYPWSSAFIPFCAYKTNLNFSKRALALPGSKFLLCSSFLPTILEGQRCYKLNLNDTSGQGKKYELMLLLDYNEDRSLHVLPYHGKGVKSSDETIDFDIDTDIQKDSAKIHINTLSPYVGFGGGSYVMTAVKRMTATEDFLKMSLKDRNCKLELYEDCRTRKLIEECSCVPWDLPGFEVKYILLSFFNVFRTLTSVIQKEGIALRGTLPCLSTAALLVLGFMQMFSGLERTLRRRRKGFWI